jgi:hypothetical protein
MLQVENQDGTWTELAYIDKKVIYDNFWSVLKSNNWKILK